MRGLTLVVAWTALLPASLLADPPKARPASKTLAPTVSDFAYGNDSERQKLDFWQAESDEPTPVVVMIHGGGWVAGDKSNYGPKQVRPFLNRGISVACVNYRFIRQAMDQRIEPPVRACLYDAARALQTIRANAKEWNIDPQRIGATGSSAGACTSLWLAMHDDLADPQSADPIARLSTRLTCAAVVGAQTSLDPRELRQWIPNAIYGGHAFGFAAPGRSRAEEFDLLLEHRDKAVRWFKEYSPIELVSSDDPPIYLSYPNQKQPPAVGRTEADPTHSAMYGVKLAERLEAEDVEVMLAYPGREDEQYGSPSRFLVEKLQSQPQPAKAPSATGSDS